MALSLAETEYGRTMLAKAMADGRVHELAPYNSPFMRMLLEPERRPHRVHYNVMDGAGHVVHVPPDEFLFWPNGRGSCSDCIWIVPGTLQR